MKNRVLTQKWIVFIFVVILLTSVVQNISYGQGSAKIYWTESDKIRRANLDGTNVESVLTDDDLIRDIALDIQNHKIYWIGWRHSIKRANLDGTKVETIYDPQALNADKVERIHSPITITLDTSAKKIYWGNMWAPWGMTRSDIDGSNIEDITILPVDGGVFNIRVDAEDIQLDVKAGKIYFQDSLNDNIARVDMNGSNYENLPPRMIYHDKIALDLVNKKMYWTKIIMGVIRTASLDGKNIETFLSDLNAPTYIALDPHSRKIYWIERDTQKHNGKIIHKRKIQRANLDGSNVTDILTGLNYVAGIALDTEGVYDVAPDTNKLTTTWADMKIQ
ncbi:hypothetical protein C6501_01620 [Candidatus Poribacteria bacterium]|nr:MAG: hypothetical protein C6501_01620 [Candidatus Poribacteria bacterium]